MCIYIYIYIYIQIYNDETFFFQKQYQYTYIIFTLCTNQLPFLNIYIFPIIIQLQLFNFIISLINVIITYQLNFHFFRASNLLTPFILQI